MVMSNFDQMNPYGNVDRTALYEKAINELKKELSSAQRPVREKFRADFILAHVPSGTEMAEIFRRLELAEKVVFPAVVEAK